MKRSLGNLVKFLAAPPGVTLKAAHFLAKCIQKNVVRGLSSLDSQAKSKLNTMLTLEEAHFLVGLYAKIEGA